MVNMYLGQKKSRNNLKFASFLYFRIPGIVLCFLTGNSLKTSFAFEVKTSNTLTKSDQKVFDPNQKVFDPMVATKKYYNIISASKFSVTDLI